MMRIASTRLGMARIKSMMRMMTTSTRPPQKAARRPNKTPDTADTNITERPMKREMREP
jgi:hypothetical protein